MKPRVLMIVTCVLLLPLRSLSATQPERPNLLVILADDLGYGDLACCGARDLQTPHIDRLFAAGMRFTNFYANCPVCSPTRAALLSGRYQDTVGVPGVIRTYPDNNWGFLSPNAELLPQAFRQNGYRTALVGKWHLGLRSPNTPTERGFEFFRGFLGDMMDDYYTHRRHGINYMYDGTTETDPKGHATDLFTQWAVEYIADASKHNQPFLLYLAYNAPHTPIQPPDDRLEAVKARNPQLSPQRAALAALIEHMDEGVGQVTEALRKTGQSENTIIVFTSDNGGQLNVGADNGPLRDGKQSMYEGGLKVPTAVVWPGRIQPGTTSEFRAMSMDILPTLAAAAEISLPETDGRSFLPTLTGTAQPQLRDAMYFCRREGGLRYGGKTIEALIQGDWKLLQNSPFEPPELYNLKADPGEQNNLAPAEQKRVAALNSVLRTYIQRGGAVPWQRPAAD